MKTERDTNANKPVKKPITIVPGIFVFDELEYDEDTDKNIIKYIYEDIAASKIQEKSEKKKTSETEK